MDELLQRYTDEQRRVIADYWECIRFTRRTAKVSDNVKRVELDYWSRFPAEIVVGALTVHIAKYPAHKEHYTRGIIRNMAQFCGGDKAKMSGGADGAKSSAASKPAKGRNRFANFDERQDTDFAVIERKERELVAKRFGGGDKIDGNVDSKIDCNTNTVTGGGDVND